MQDLTNYISQVADSKRDIDRLRENIRWCVDRHAETAHKYDGYLPYEYHLRMVAGVCDRFIHLVGRDHGLRARKDALRAAWGHDLIEDARVTYNDVKKVLGEPAADIVYALTNDKGKTREERAGERYYSGIRETPLATFVKLCDRIANAEYSAMTRSRMLEVYRSENPKFCELLGDSPSSPYREMFDHLRSVIGLS
jgi:(p)ppGpp synthase/HD superfamily hydrolase